MLLCEYEMKKFMKVTSEILFPTGTRYEAENGSNRSCNFVFNSGPQVFSGPSIPKHALKYLTQKSFATIGESNKINYQ